MLLMVNYERAKELIKERIDMAKSMAGESSEPMFRMAWTERMEDYQLAFNALCICQAQCDRAEVACV